jgi:hypothetical protein
MNPRDPTDPFADVEIQHPLVAELADGASSQPLTVRLGDLWMDLLRVDDAASAPESPPRIPSAMPLFDYMKGIMQWD